MLNKLLKVFFVPMLCLSTQVFAAPIISYDIQSATNSGVGLWSHTYNGTITAIDANFSNYTGGSGTLNDGVIGDDLDNAHLFCEEGDCGDPGNNQPIITLFFDAMYTINDISIFGGDFGDANLIPGALNGFDITIGGLTESFTTSEFGLVGLSGQGVNDLATVTGTALANIATNQLTLSNFTYLEAGNSQRGRFSITEIQINSDAVMTASTPSFLLLFVMGLFGVFLSKRQK